MRFCQLDKRLKTYGLFSSQVEIHYMNLYFTRSTDSSVIIGLKKIVLPSESACYQWLVNPSKTRMGMCIYLYLNTNKNRDETEQDIQNILKYRGKVSGE